MSFDISGFKNTGRLQILRNSMFDVNFYDVDEPFNKQIPLLMHEVLIHPNGKVKLRGYEDELDHMIRFGIHLADKDTISFCIKFYDLSGKLQFEKYFLGMVLESDSYVLDSKTKETWDGAECNKFSWDSIGNQTILQREFVFVPKSNDAPV